MFRLFAFACCLVTVTLNQIAAQQPTEAQRDALRAACRSDFMAHCSGVQPGGKEALECLVRNDSKLSASCRSAVDAIAVAPQAPAASPNQTPPAEPPPKAAETVPQQDELAAVRKDCTLDDLMAHCSWIAPNNPEILLCLKANATDLSPACRSAVQSMPSTATPAAAEAPPPNATPLPPAPPAQSPPEPRRAAVPVAPAPQPAATASKKPSPQQISAIRSACRSDFMANCPGVQPGGASALQCLERNAAKLSAPCQSAVAAIGTGAPAAGTAAGAAAAPAVAPLGAMPPMRPREALAILKICGADQQALCAGISMGGGRLLTCLVENASKLSPECYGALAAARR